MGVAHDPQIAGLGILGTREAQTGQPQEGRESRSSVERTLGPATTGMCKCLLSTMEALHAQQKAHAAERDTWRGA